MPRVKTEAGSKLEEAIAAADAVSTPPTDDKAKARSFVFGNVNAAKEKQIDDRYPSLVETTFDKTDWDATITEFEEWLELGDYRTDEAHIRRSHERGPAIVRRLNKVAIQVRFARENWERENEVLLGAMRDQATKMLQNEKAKGERSKAITEADIVAAMVAIFPDEYNDQERKRAQYKHTEDRVKHDVDVAVMRCRHLDSMLNRIR